MIAAQERNHTDNKASYTLRWRFWGGGGGECATTDQAVTPHRHLQQEVATVGRSCRLTLGPSSKVAAPMSLQKAHWHDRMTSLPACQLRGVLHHPAAIWDRASSELTYMYVSWRGNLVQGQLLPVPLQRGS